MPMLSVVYWIYLKLILPSCKEKKLEYAPSELPRPWALSSGSPNISHQVKRDPTWAVSTFPYGSLHCPHPDFPFVLPKWGNGRLTQTLTGSHRALPSTEQPQREPSRGTQTTTPPWALEWRRVWRQWKPGMDSISSQIPPPGVPIILPPFALLFSTFQWMFYKEPTPHTSWTLPLFSTPICTYWITTLSKHRFFL